MILIGGDIDKLTLLQNGLPQAFVDQCEVKDTSKRATLEIKLKSWARGSECEKVYLHKDFINIELLPDVKVKTEYFQDIKGLLHLLKMYIEDVDTRHLSEDILKGVTDNFIDSDGTPVTTFQLDADEPEPNEDPHRIQDLVLPEVPKLDIVLEDVEQLEIPPLDGVVESYEKKEQLQKEKEEIEIKEVKLKKLELENKEAQLKKEKAEIKKSDKKRFSLFRFIMAILLTPLDWVGNGLKLILGSIVGTICVYVGYCLLTGKPVDLQAGVSLYESFKALVVKVASDIQNYR